jgi:hypothetical protein
MQFTVRQVAGRNKPFHTGRVSKLALPMLLPLFAHFDATVGHADSAELVAIGD